jgi:predicted MFS family arabinose efflux permease
VNEAFRPANSTAIAFYSKPENRTRSYALNRLAINVGWAVGMAIGGLISEISFELLFWVDGCTNIAAALTMWLFLKPVDYKPSAEKVANATPARSPYSDRTYLQFILATFFFAACFFQVFTNLSVYLEKELHFSKSFIGMLMAVNGIIIALVEMALVFRLENRGKIALLIPGGVALVGIGFLMMNIPSTGYTAILALAMIVVVTFGEIFSMPFMNSYWIRRTEISNRGQYAGLYTMAWSAAQSLGPLIGAQVAQYAGFTVLWWSIGAVSLLAAMGFYKVLNRNT